MYTQTTWQHHDTQVNFHVPCIGSPAHTNATIGMVPTSGASQSVGVSPHISDATEISLQATPMHTYGQPYNAGSISEGVYNPIKKYMYSQGVSPMKMVPPNALPPWSISTPSSVVGKLVDMQEDVVFTTPASMTPNAIFEDDSCLENHLRNASPSSSSSRLRASNPSCTPYKSSFRVVTQPSHVHPEDHPSTVYSLDSMYGDPQLYANGSPWDISSPQLTCALDGHPNATPNGLSNRHPREHTSSSMATFPDAYVQGFRDGYCEGSQTASPMASLYVQSPKRLTSLPPTTLPPSTIAVCDQGVDPLTPTPPQANHVALSRSSTIDTSKASPYSQKHLSFTPSNCP